MSEFDSRLRLPNARVVKLVIHERLKISCSQERVGSTPTPGTITYDKITLLRKLESANGTAVAITDILIF